MQSPEQPNKSANLSQELRQKTHRDPLHLRMYFHKHLTAFVRLFGHQELTIDEAREQLRPLVEEFGEKRVNQATGELLVTVRYQPEQTVRLSDRVRRLARPLIGPPPEPVETDHPVSFAETFDRISDEESLTEISQDEPEGESKEISDKKEKEQHSIQEKTPSTQEPQTPSPLKPVTLPIREVKVRFENWLKETGKKILLMTSEQRAEFSENRLATLDVVVYGEEQHRLVTVRRKITKLQIHDMLEWQKVFGTDFHPCNVWPYKGSDGWIWEYTPIPSEST